MFAMIRSLKLEPKLLSSRNLLGLPTGGDLLLHNYNSKKMGPCVTFSGIKVKIFDLPTLVYICLHLPSDLSTLVYIRLVTCLHWSTFVYICLWLV